MNQGNFFLLYLHDTIKKKSQMHIIMRQLLLITILFALTLSVSSQIEKQHAFDDVASYHKLGNNYYYVATDTNTVYLYNADFSLNKTVSVDDSLRISTAIPYVNVFTTSGGIDFHIAAYSKKERSRRYTLIKDDNGSIIKFIPNLSYVRYNRLVAWRNDGGSDVYSLPGQTSIKSVESKSMQAKAYPNPTHDVITINFDMEPGEIQTVHIYNANGMLIDTKQVGGRINHLLLDVSHYLRGMYIYEYNNNSGRFIVQ